MLNSAKTLAYFGLNAYLCNHFTAAAMVELVDTRDLKSLDPKRSCGFESRSRHTTHGHSKRVSGYG